MEFSPLLDNEFYCIKSSWNEYVRVDPYANFIIKRLVSGYDPEQLSLEFFFEFNIIGEKYISNFLTNLYHKGFFTKKPIFIYHKINQILVKNSSKVIKSEKAVSFVNYLFNKGAGIFFNKNFILCWIFFLVYCLYLLFFRLEFSIVDFFQSKTDFILNLVFIIISKIIITSFHELFHGLATLSCKRKINNAGIMSYMGIYAFFVDTSDIWMRPRKDRIIVSLAGIYSTLVLLSIFIPFYFHFFPNFLFAKQFIVVGVLGIVLNLNPLLKLDGYYIFIDVVKMPQIGKQSFEFYKNFVQNPLGVPWNKKNIIKFFYGIGLVLMSIGTIFLVYFLLFSRLEGILLNLLKENILAIKILGLVILVASIPLFYKITKFIYKFIHQMYEKIRKIESMKSHKNHFLLFFALGLLSPFISLKITLLVMLLTLKEIKSFKMSKFLLRDLVYLLLFIPLGIFHWNVLLILPLVYYGYRFSLHKNSAYQYNVGWYLLVSILCFFNLKAAILLIPLTFIFLLSFSRSIQIQPVYQLERKEVYKGDMGKIESAFKMIMIEYTRILLEFYGKKWVQKFYFKLNGVSAMILFFYPKDLEHIQIEFSKDVEITVKVLSQMVKKYVDCAVEFMQEFTPPYQPQAYLLVIVEKLFWMQKEVFVENVLNVKMVGDSGEFAREGVLGPIYDILKRNELFKLIKHEDREQVVESLLLVKYQPQEYIFNFGDKGDAFYIVYSGSVSVIKDDVVVAVLSKGDIFGEKSLVYKQPRNASIKANGDVEVLQMNQEIFDLILQNNPNFKISIEEYAKKEFKFDSFINGIPIFKNLTSDQWIELKNSLYFKEMKAFDWVFLQNDPGDKFYVIKSGSVEIILNGEQPKVLATLSVGEYFGEMALFSQKPRSASVRCVVDCIFFVLEKEKFESLFSEDALMSKVSSRRKKEIDAF